MTVLMEPLSVTLAIAHMTLGHSICMWKKTETMPVMPPPRSPGRPLIMAIANTVDSLCVCVSRCFLQEGDEERKEVEEGWAGWSSDSQHDLLHNQSNAAAVSQQLSLVADWTGEHVCW